MLENNVKMLKRDLRIRLLQKRAEVSREVMNNVSDKICKTIIAHPLFKASQNMMVYIPFRDEVDIREVIETAWLSKKNILVPKTEKKRKWMDLYKIDSWKDLELGNYQLSEPVILNKTPFPIEKIELVLVPGVGFDVHGFRLGYGGGYYDRFFDRFTLLPNRIGIGYDFQMLEEIPISEHDYQMNEVITENRHLKW